MDSPGPSPLMGPPRSWALPAHGPCASPLMGPAPPPSPLPLVLMGPTPPPSPSWKELIVSGGLPGLYDESMHTGGGVQGRERTEAAVRRA